MIFALAAGLVLAGSGCEDGDKGVHGLMQPGSAEPSGAAGPGPAPGTPAPGGDRTGMATGMEDVEPLAPSAITDGEMDRFIRAFTRVMTIHAQIREMMDATTTPPQGPALQMLEQRANNMILTAVESENLTPERYQRLLATVNSNKELADRAATKLQAHMMDLRSKSHAQGHPGGPGGPGGMPGGMPGGLPGGAPAGQGR